MESTQGRNCERVRKRVRVGKTAKKEREIKKGERDRERDRMRNEREK